MYPDFGAWVTKSQYSVTIASFLALSGGVSSIADLPGVLEKHLLEKMYLPSGKLLSKGGVLSLSPDSQFVNPVDSGALYKAYLCDEQGQGVLWVANLCKEERGVSGFISPKDIPELRGERFYVSSQKGGALGVLEKEQAIKVKLKPSQADIWTFTPIHDGVAVLGCPSFFNMGACIERVTLEENNLYVRTCLYGPLVVYSRKKILEVRSGGEVVSCDYDPEKCLLIIDEKTNIKEISSEFVVYFE
jgi:hypothetical protein